MEPVETIQATPTTRVCLYNDTDAENPLEWWDHGIQFVTLPDPSRTWRDYKEPTSNTYDSVSPLHFGDMYAFREFHAQDGYDQEQPRHMSPSLRTFLNTHCAAWGTLDRSGYDGTLSLRISGDLDGQDAIAFVSRDIYRAWHGIPEGKPMPRGYREDAAKALQSVIDEYNGWATGDVYGYTVEEHNPACPYCDDKANPDPGCPCWDINDDSCWGFIGYEYAMEEANRVAENYQNEQQAAEQAV